MSRVRAWRSFAVRPSDSQNDTFDSYGPVLDKSVRIYMKDVECSEMNEKSNFRFFRSLFFELWTFLYAKYGLFSMNFHGNSKKKICNFSFRFSFVSERFSTIWIKKSKRLS